ncbi:DExH-box ATP-dependent RNA helicase DExH6 isoform X1 [Quercus lobata]|uniref:RNA helicase n=2 Tax=Quercus lobata TaxID=97700 RepID=A0A7N2MDV5_QUELO|nr:DExH-box ATP-dependent RNA helicase DExH6 isoform X1 [Quercus lobata]
MARNKKKKLWKRDNVDVSKLNIAESTTIHITQQLQKFFESKAEVYKFEDNLSSDERAAVHELCRKMGMTSKSKGHGGQRRVSVFKPKKQVATRKGPSSLTHLTFSEGAKVVLHDLFTQYPPDDEEVDKEKVGKKTERVDKMRRSKVDIFLKPSMSKAEIAKKVESLASKIERAANLKQVTEGRSKLPIASFRDVITSTIESHQVVLISGETGCGKTTQVPQYLLDNMWGKGEACKIVCTQPRRISATSVAERICYERGGNIGDDVGYKIRLESKGGRNSSIVFCTNGILLRVLISEGAGRLKTEGGAKPAKREISGITHIIVDEIHERDRYSDFMLAILRDFLPSCPHLRLILMSATIDAERFSQYFGGCPIIRVPGFTYPVNIFYLEDVLLLLKSVENNNPDNTLAVVPSEDPELTEEEKLALDEALNLAWSSDEFDPLLELVSSEGTQKVFNYQHSLTGLSPLMVFAGKGRVADVCMLLSFGADCHLQAKDGSTALELAERENQQEATVIIKKHMESSISNSIEEQQILDKYLGKMNPELIDVVLIEQLIRRICTDSQEGAILVFLPGWEDINKTREKLNASAFFKDTSKFMVLCLHSMIPSVEQKKVFKRPPPGCRKIVLATNIAETAITIDDVVYVIDSGRMKEKSYDPYNNVSTLQSSWVSKASAKQREGRAGRCQPGICYHLYSKLRADSLPEFQLPEIKRIPIEELCLQVKLLDPNCKIEDFLNKTLDPPVFEAVRNAILVLQDIGALSVGEKLTELGEKLGSLPVHPLTSKMLFFAIMMNCLDPALTLACASDYRDPFTLPMLLIDKKRADAAKSELASLYGGTSDQLAVIAAFECWNNAKQRGQEERFCSEYFISKSTMSMLSGMRKQLQNELIRNGLIPDDVSRCSLNARDPGVLHAVLVAGLYPMVGRLRPPHKNAKRFVETSGGDKVRLHPHSTNFKLSFSKTNHCPLIMYDEVTRGDGGMIIRNSTVVGPLPLLLLATEIAVAPANNDDEDEEDEDDDSDGDESDEDGMDIDKKSVGRHEEKIMSSPDNSVTVIVDRWLFFGSTALDIAQIYCLRERLLAAILFKVTHPRTDLPPVLAASMHALARILSYDGLSGVSFPLESVDSLTSMVNATEIDKYSPGKKKEMVQNPNGFLRSLTTQGTPKRFPCHHHNTRVPASKGPTNLGALSSHNVRPPLNSAGMKFAPQGSRLNGDGLATQSHGPRGDSLKRQRENGTG